MQDCNISVTPDELEVLKNLVDCLSRQFLYDVPGVYDMVPNPKAVYLVAAGTDVPLSVDVGKQVYRCSGTGSNDYLLPRLGINQFPYGLPSCLVMLCRSGCQTIDGSVDVGIGISQPAGRGVYHAAGLLGSCSIVEVNQLSAAAPCTLEIWKKTPYLFFILNHGCYNFKIFYKSK